MTTLYKTREEWMHEAVAAIREIGVEVAGMEVPEKLYVSVGFPSGGSMRIGECHYGTADGNRTIFVSPQLDDPVQVLATLLHELIHASLDAGVGHRGRFVTTMKRWGLGGVPTSTTAVKGSHLHDALTALARELGEYPHSKLDRRGRRSGPKKQGTRMLKVSCPDCGYVARTTSKWLDEIGEPICPCNNEPMTRES